MLSGSGQESRFVAEAFRHARAGFPSGPGSSSGATRGKDLTKLILRHAVGVEGTSKVGEGVGKAEGITGPDVGMAEGTAGCDVGLGVRKS